MSEELPDPGRAQRFLVAGAAGFIGSHLTDRLLTLGHHVVAVDNFLTGDARNLAHLLDHPRFRFIRHDVIEPLRVDDPIDWVMHFASPASPPKYLKYPLATLRCNSEGTYNLLELARSKNAGLFYASTSEVYGDPAVHPQPESYWGHVNPNGPRSVYDEAKRFGEALITSYHEQHGLPIRIVRIFNTYGPRMKRDDGRVVVNFISQVLSGRPITVYGKGTQTRSFQYIDDLLDGVLRLLASDYTRPVNIGNPQEYSVLELAHLVRELTGSQAPIVYRSLPKDDPRQRRPDITLATTLLNWQPRVAVREGLQSTIAYFRSEAGRSERVPRLKEATAPAPRHTPVADALGAPVPAGVRASSLRRPARG